MTPINTPLHGGSRQSLSLYHQRPHRAEHDAFQRVLGNRHREPAGVSQHAIEIASQGPAAGQHDSQVHNIGRELRNGLLDRRETASTIAPTGSLPAFGNDFAGRTWPASRRSMSDSVQRHSGVSSSASSARSNRAPMAERYECSRLVKEHAGHVAESGRLDRKSKRPNSSHR